MGFKAGQKVRIKYLDGVQDVKDLALGAEAVIVCVDAGGDFPIELEGYFEHVAEGEIEAIP